MISQPTNLTLLKLVGRDIKLLKFLDENTGCEYLMKKLNSTEEKVYLEVFPRIMKMNIDFNVLQFPQVFQTGNQIVVNDEGKKIADLNNRVIFVKNESGIRFNDQWNEAPNNPSYGGKTMSSDLAIKSINLLEDFSQIDLTKLYDLNLRRFDFETWKSKSLPQRIEWLKTTKNLSDENISVLGNIMDSYKNSKIPNEMITNGDFYPRNFIQLPDGKIVVIDWESQDERTSLINTAEFHVAFMYIHMWGNPQFQKALIKEGIKRLSLDTVNLQVAILSRALDQWIGCGWFNIPAGNEIKQILIAALDPNFIKRFLIT